VVECRGPESFGADLVCEFVDGNAKSLESSPRFIKCSFAAMLCFVPGRHDDGVEVKLLMRYRRTGGVLV
jgi:hypothetical protein